MEETGLTILIVKTEEERDERCKRAQYLLMIPSSHRPTEV